jgi:glycerol-3-phosphate acyltransferase PlsY
MFPLYLGFRHGGKGTTTATFGALAVVPDILPAAVLFSAATLTVLKFYPKGFRLMVTMLYCSYPWLISIYLGNWHVFVPVAIISFLSILFGLFHKEDLGQTLSLRKGSKENPQ